MSQNSKKTNFLHTLLSKIKKLKLFYFLLKFFINSLTAILYSLSLGIFCSILLPENPLASLTFGTLLFLILMVYTNQWRMKKPMESSLLLSLDMEFPEASTSVYNRELWNEAGFQDEWNEKTKSFLKKINDYEKTKISRSMWRLAPALFLAIFFLKWNGAFFYASTRDLIQSFAHRGVVLTVLEGGSNKLKKESLLLSPKHIQTIPLSQKNFVEIEFYEQNQKEIPSIEIRKNSEDANLIQSFQMSASKEGGVQSFRIQFSVLETSFLFIPQYSGKALVKFLVDDPLSPRVSLQSLLPIPEQWPDEKTLELVIKAEAKHPLRNINLLINVAGHDFRESVETMNGDSSYHSESTYSLSLNKYLDRDFAKVEIRAEAIDQSLPTPLVGYSQPLVIQTISSYGTYRKILSKLKILKDSLDTAIAKSTPKLQENEEASIDEIQKEAALSPFFDSMDRNRIAKFNETLKYNSENPDLKLVYQVSQSLNSFLQEHEILDDRERDRDFFVAARGLSHLLDSTEASSPIIKIAEQKIQSFLLEREKRWKLRIGRLTHPEKLKNSKKIVNQHYFSKNFEKLIQKKLKNKETLEVLSELVSEYRQWIDDLEALEDKEREARDKQEQKALSSARDELKELQARQLEVAKALHNADNRSQEQMQREWPAARMHENTNIQNSKKLEEKINALAPRSAERLSAAIQAMHMTLESGENSDFTHSESFADLASRLLHQASKMTEKEQRESRRAYRNSSDKYYGQSIIGGDVEIEHDYRVDPRYREDVLDEVVKSEYQGDNRVILNNFLKRIIR